MTRERATTNLTQREKDCLQGVLEQKTAKEMALELGISHHAVEKRLRSARKKLGAQTSRDAARIFAESCGRTAYGASAVPIASPSNDIEPHEAASNRGTFLLGGLTMFLTALAAAAFILSATPSGINETEVQPSAEYAGAANDASTVTIAGPDEEMGTGEPITEIVRGAPIVTENSVPSTLIVADSNAVGADGRPKILSEEERGDPIGGPGVVQVHRSDEGALSAKVARDE